MQVPLIGDSFPLIAYILEVIKTKQTAYVRIHVRAHVRNVHTQKAHECFPNREECMHAAVVVKVCHDSIVQ